MPAVGSARSRSSGHAAARGRSPSSSKAVTRASSARVFARASGRSATEPPGPRRTLALSSARSRGPPDVLHLHRTSA